MRPIDKIFPEHQHKINDSVCTSCGENANTFRDALSKKEFGISGLCQKCQDKVFG